MVNVAPDTTPVEVTDAAVRSARNWTLLPKKKPDAVSVPTDRAAVVSAPVAEIDATVAAPAVNGPVLRDVLVSTPRVALAAVSDELVTPAAAVNGAPLMRPPFVEVRALVTIDARVAAPAASTPTEAVPDAVMDVHVSELTVPAGTLSDAAVRAPDAVTEPAFTDWAVSGPVLSDCALKPPVSTPVAAATAVAVTGPTDKLCAVIAAALTLPVDRVDAVSEPDTLRVEPVSEPEL
jgi:hypothetical protein